LTDLKKMFGSASVHLQLLLLHIRITGTDFYLIDSSAIPPADLPGDTGSLLFEYIINGDIRIVVLPHGPH